MIKINLLPAYIIERRRVKALAVLIVFLLIVETLLFMAYVWAPAPFSLTSSNKQATERRDKALADQYEVEALMDEVEATKASYQTKGSWVSWVDEADGKPKQWTQYFRTITKYFPADVVVHGLPLPSGNRLNLQGSTSSMMAAARWYLNMLRCEMVQPDINAVDFSPGQLAAGAANPRMAMPVSISIALKPEYLDMMMPVSMPAGITTGGRTGGGGRMGAGGGGRRGGGGGRRGGGGRGRGR